MPKRPRTQITDLQKAVLDNDVAAVKNLFDVPYENVKRRRIENLIDERDQGKLDSWILVVMCANGSEQSKQQKQMDILKFLLKSIPEDRADFAAKKSAKLLFALPMFPDRGNMCSMVSCILDAGRYCWKEDLTEHVIMNFYESNAVDALQLLIDRGLPKIGFRTLCGAASSKQITVDTFQFLLEHADFASWPQDMDGPDQAQHIIDVVGASEVRTELVQCVRDWPLKKVNMLAKTMHPGHPLRGETCAICYDDFKCGHKVVQLGCKHLFCKHCILPVVNSAQYNCPMCRQCYL